MEYLTLQDIPHRHCEPLHSRKMNSTHSAESPLANMVAAVSHESATSPSSTSPCASTSLISPLPLSAPLFLEPALKAPSPALPGPFRASGQALAQGEKVRSLQQRAMDPPLPAPHPRPLLSGSVVMDRHAQEAEQCRSFAFPHHHRPTSPPPMRQSNLHSILMPNPLEPYRSLPDDDNYDAHAHQKQPTALNTTSTLTELQNHHMRNSPPIQPGEQHFPGKLPSFSEFLHTTRTTTPPRTPQRRHGSADSSPHAQPHFDEVAWAESKRRRVDTLGDIYARSTVEQPFAEPRRMSSAIDPALASYSPHGPQQHPVQPVPSNYSHRSTPSYPPPHQQPPPMNPHIRHRSSPVPPGQMPFAQPAIHQPVAQNPYQSSMVQGYYHDHQAAAYSGYERSQDSYYPRASYSGYDAPYGGDIRFQHNVGLDHSAFNRKRRGNLPKEATNLLKDWFAANRQSPYPTEDQKMELCNRTGLSLNQVSNWFINARRRAPQKEQREREANGPDA